jgi:hypothetical protein
MSHFAKVKNNIVEEVIVAEQDFIDSLPPEEGVSWIQTSYNTHAGVHQLGGTPLRKNYAGKGFRYDSIRDAFIPPKPFDAWTLNEDSCQWEPPFLQPTDGKLYCWDGTVNQWVEWNYD